MTRGGQLSPPISTGCRQDTRRRWKDAESAARIDVLHRFNRCRQQTAAVVTSCVVMKGQSAATGT